MNQLIAFLRYRTEAVDHALAECLHFLIPIQMVEFTIEQHSLGTAGNIGIREIHLQVAVYGAIVYEVIARKLLALFHLFLIEVVELLVLQFGYCLRENLLVGFVTQVFHESALFGTQQVAGTTDIQVLHGEVETAAQVAEGFQGFQSAACVEGERSLRRSYQIAECLLVATPHSASHLVQVAQSEVVGIHHDDGVGIGDIDSVLHDGGGEQHVEVVVDESHDDLFQFLGLHLSMSDGYAAIGHLLLYQHLQFGELGYPVAYEINLSVAAHLEVDGIGYGFRIEGDHLCMNRKAVWRRGAHDAHVAGAHQRKLQGARDRRGTHGEGVYVHLQLAQLLLGGNAELLLLVDDEQTQVVPMHGFGNELVGSDEDIYLA